MRVYLLIAAAMTATPAAAKPIQIVADTSEACAGTRAAEFQRQRILSRARAVAAEERQAGRDVLIVERRDCGPMGAAGVQAFRRAGFRILSERN